MNLIVLGQIFVSVIIIVLVLLQAKGTGLGTAFGGSGNVYQTKKGVEKIVFNLTIILVILLSLLAIINLKI